MTKTTKIVYGSVLGVIAVLLAIGGVFDLTIANNVYQPDNLVARILECAGYLPPFLFVGAMFAVFFFRVKEEDEKRTLKKVATVVCTALVYIAFGFMMSGEILSVLWQKVLVGVGSTILLTPLTLLFFRRRNDEELKRFEIFLVFATIVCVISSLFTVNVIKFLWGRARYREMMADGDVFFEAFTPWFKPNGLTLHGHHSFPSGHTCAATNMLVLCALDEVFPSANGKKKAINIVVAMWIFIIAYSRLVLGAHFLSDVTAGFTIGLVTFAVARYVFFDKNRRVIRAILEVNEKESNAEAADAVIEGKIEGGVLSEQEAAEKVEASSEDTVETGEKPEGNE